MGLLDDIHKQADDKRQLLSEEEHLAYKQEKTYLEHINPRLKKVYSYFNELVNELNFLDNPVYCAYEIPGAGIQQGFYHGKYNIASNSSERMTEIRISFLCQRDKPINFIIDNELRANTVIDDLHRFKVGSDHRPHFGQNGIRSGTQFDLTGQIPVHIKLYLVPGSIEIKLETFNLPSLGLFEKTFKPHELDDQFMEQLGLFLLRRENSIMKFDLPAQNRKVIQENLKHDKANKLKEKIQSQLYNPEAIQENKAPKPGFFKRLFSRN
jgi:hypothetical protein